MLTFLWRIWITISRIARYFHFHSISLLECPTHPQTLTIGRFSFHSQISVPWLFLLLILQVLGVRSSAQILSETSISFFIFSCANLCLQLFHPRMLIWKTANLLQFYFNLTMDLHIFTFSILLHVFFPFNRNEI